MRTALAALLLFLAGSASASAQSDPYRWCADYGVGREALGATNCYFVTLAQCRATVSGVGGYCTPNPFYTGPAERPPRRAKRRAS